MFRASFDANTSKLVISVNIVATAVPPQARPIDKRAHFRRHSIAIEPTRDEHAADHPHGKNQNEKMEKIFIPPDHSPENHASKQEQQGDGDTPVCEGPVRAATVIHA